MFTGDNAMLGAATSIAGPLTHAARQRYRTDHGRRPRHLDHLRGDRRSASASSASGSTTSGPRCGRTTSLKILTKSYRGEEKISTVPIDIPSNAAGRLSILVTDGRQLNTIEQRDIRRSLDPQSVAQMLKLLNETRRNNRIYVRLMTGTPGAVVNGEAMAALPPSVLAVLEGDRNGGSFTPIRSATVGEWELPMESAVTGSRLLTIEVDNGSGR